MRKRILALFMSVALLANVSELSYITAYAAEPQGQVVQQETTAGTEGTTESATGATDAGTETTQESTIVTTTEITQEPVGDLTGAEETASQDAETPEDAGSTEQSNSDISGQTSEGSTDGSEMAAPSTSEVPVNGSEQDAGADNGLVNHNDLDVSADTTIVYDYQVINLGEEVTLPQAASEKYYLFSPSEDSWYDFKVTSGTISMIDLYEYDVTTNTTNFITNDYNGNGVYSELKSGNQYLFRINYSSNMDCKFIVNKMSEISGITATSPTVSSILGYYKGLKLDGATMTISHLDGTSEIVSLDNILNTYKYKGQYIAVCFGNQDYSSVCNSLTPGSNTATIKYMTQTADMNINFVENTITKIEILSEPTNMTGYNGDRFASLSLNGLTIRTYAGEQVVGDVIYSEESNNFSYTVLSDAGDPICQNYYDMTAGDYNIEIYYKGCSVASIGKPLHILENKVSSIEIAKAPVKTSYIDMVDTYYNLAGMELKVNYSDGTSEVLPYSNLTCSSYMENNVDFRVLSPMDTPYHVIIVYRGKTAMQDIYITASPVKEIKVLSNPTKLNYIANAERYIDLNGLKVEVTFNDGRPTETVQYGYNGTSGYYLQCNNSDIDFTKVGTQPVTISYMGF